ncbi:hypothetical protein PRIPAC_85008 [Pristionchus pacificus]|uniref:Uncharacterized protein n=1 Tax=Pristionchus pacificus TaxID=54126 RepID=A0A2A6BM76_PRIPA|nr:hypothetical protein PRIPAC_85008 [Pristionchus pacificus]|eukprot:PDM66913.1 hypothetical protein PRIPAC_48330 [Pristionchus pacificus]
MSTTGRNRKSKLKADVVTIDDDGSSIAPSSEASVKVEEEEQQHACRTARAAVLRAEYAEKLLENKRELVSTREKAAEIEVDERVAELQKQLEGARNRSENAFASKVEATRERDELRLQVAELKIATERQVRVLREKYAGLEEGESDLAREIATLKRDLEEANGKKDELGRKISSLREELNDANSSKVELARELSSLKRDQEEASGNRCGSVADSAELEAARRREEAANTANAERAKENAALKDEVEQLRIDLKNALARENASLMADIDQLRRKKNEDIDKEELARKHAALKDEIEQLRRSMANGITTNDELAHENAALKADIEQLRRSIEEANGNDDLAREHAALKRELDRERLKSEKAPTEKIEGTVENVLLKRELAELREHEEQRRARAASSSQQGGGLVISEESDLAEENAALKEELAELRSIVNDAHNSDSYLEVENKSLKDQLAFARVQAAAANVQQIDTVRERDALKAEANKLAKLQLELTERNATLVDALAVVRSLRPAQEETSNLVNQVHALNAQVAFERAATEKIRASNVELERRLAQAEGRLKRTSQEFVVRDPRVEGRRSESVERQRQPLASPSLEKRSKLDEQGRKREEARVQPLQQQPHSHQHPTQQQQQPRNSLQSYPMQQLQPQNYPQSTHSVQQPLDSLSLPAATQFDMVGDLTNLYHLVQPGSRDAVPIDEAAGHVRTVFEQYYDTLFMGSNFLPSQGESAHCELCNVDLDKISIITHFCSQDHANKMRDCGACVSMPALFYWIRKMTPAKK